MLPLSVIADGEMDSGIISLDFLVSTGCQPKIIYSAGIGEQINFEFDILKRLDGLSTQLCAFDPTPKSQYYLKGLKLPDSFRFFPYALSDTDGILQFALPTADGWVSGSAVDVKNDSRKLDFKNKINVQGRSIKSIMNEMGHSYISLLKLDIEGSEFSVIDSILNEKIPVEQIIVDVHNTMVPNGKRITLEMIDRLREHGYKIFYVERDRNKSKCISAINTTLGRYRVSAK